MLVTHVLGEFSLSGVSSLVEDPENRSIICWRETAGLQFRLPGSWDDVEVLASVDRSVCPWTGLSRVFFEAVVLECLSSCSTGSAEMNSWEIRLQSIDNRGEFLTELEIDLALVVPVSFSGKFELEYETLAQRRENGDDVRVLGFKRVDSLRRPFSLLKRKGECIFKHLGHSGWANHDLMNYDKKVNEEILYRENI